MVVYVVLEPQVIQGVYDTWPACEAAVRGVPGARYRKVENRAIAEQLLSGQGRCLSPGQYAFVDGNHLGGVGVVFVLRHEDSTTEIRELAATIQEVSPGLAEHVGRLRNPLAELVAAYVALREADGGELTVVHDYEGTGAWIEGRWRMRDPVISQVGVACRMVIAERGLRVTFQWQRGHQSARGGDEYAEFNARADRLATQAVSA